MDNQSPTPNYADFDHQTIVYIGNKERLESTFNKKYLLIINLEPQLHGLWLQIIGYVGSREKFESTFFKISYE